MWRILEEDAIRAAEVVIQTPPPSGITQAMHMFGRFLLMKFFGVTHTFYSMK